MGIGQLYRIELVGSGMVVGIVNVLYGTRIDITWPTSGICGT